MLAIVKPLPKITQSVQFFEQHNIATVGIAPIDIRSNQDQCRKLEQAISSGLLHTSTCIVTSTEAAKRLVAMRQKKMSLFHSVLCVGESCAAILAPFFQSVHYPVVQTSEGLVAELLPKIKGSVTLIKGQGGRQVIQTFLQQHRIHYTEYNVYQRIELLPPFTTSILNWSKADMIVVTSASLLTHLLSAYAEENLRTKPLIVPSERVKQVAIANECETIYTSDGATDKHLLGCIKALLRGHT
jgi:uroporphyrinogen-III synthase